MKTLKNILFATLIAAALMACESRKDIYEQKNTPPSVTLGTDKKQSLDVTLRHGSDVVIDYTVEDNFMGESDSITVSVINNDGPLCSIQASLDKNNKKLRLLSNDPKQFNPEQGDSKVTVYVSAFDYYNKKTTAQVNLTMHVNMPPTPSFLMSKADGTSSLEYVINASSSSDIDFDNIVAYEYIIGGEIMYNQPGYETTVNNVYNINPGQAAKGGTYIISTPLKSINHIFQATGNYKIAVRCKDALGMWSNWIEKEITIE